MKQQWRTVTQEQESRFSGFKERRSLIGVDLINQSFAWTNPPIPSTLTFMYPALYIHLNTLYFSYTLCIDLILHFVFVYKLLDWLHFSITEKDVNRTDRNHPFFEGEHNLNVTVLHDILMTYVMYNFDLGYVQGMSDLLAPILYVTQNEATAFWCFVGYMDMVVSIPSDIIIPHMTNLPV